METTRSYSVVLESGDDGHVVVECPALPGCVSQGRDRAEALVNIREAIELYLEGLVARGLPIPEEDVETVEVAVS